MRNTPRPTVEVTKLADRLQNAARFCQLINVRLKRVEDSLDLIEERNAIQFEALHDETEALWKAIAKDANETRCTECDKTFNPKRSDARYCSDRCRQRFNRRTKK